MNDFSMAQPNPSGMEEETQNTQVPAHRFSAFHFLFSALPFNRR